MPRMSELAQRPPAPHEGADAPVPSVAAKAVRGSMWTMGGYAAGQVIRLGGNLVLTRLLFPAVFGEMALVGIFLQGLQMFSDVGTGPAIVQNPQGDDPAFLRTAWTVQALRGVLLWIASWAIAVPVARFYGQPLLAWLVPAAGFSAVLAGLESTSMHTLQRHLRLERLTVVELSSQVAGVAANVVLALLALRLVGPKDPRAVWAIIGGGLVSSGARLALSHLWLPGIRHRFEINRAALRQQLRFGRWIFLSTFLTFLAGQSDRLIFGKLVPLDLFGVFSIAAMLASLPTQAILKLGGAVVFPAYSRLVDRPDFPALFSRVRLPLLLAGATVISGLLAGGPFLVRVMYDARYDQAGWILQYMAAVAWFQILEVTNGAALLATGHVRWVAAGNAAKLMGMVALIPVGFHLGGFPGALAGLALSEALKYLTAALGARMAGLPGFARDVAVTAAITLVSAAGAWVAVATSRRAAPAFVALAAAAAVVLAAWGPFALAYLWKERESRRDRAMGVAP